MTIPNRSFSPCHGVCPLRPRLGKTGWQKLLQEPPPRLEALTDRFGRAVNIQSRRSLPPQ